MKADEITIEMNAKLTVDRETAETCLKLVELYINQNDVDIIARREETGELRMRFEDKEE